MGEGQARRPVVEQAWGRGMVVEVARTPKRVVGCVPWLEEEPSEVGLA